MGRRVIHRRHIDRDGRRLGDATTAHRVGEAVRAVVVGDRGVGDRAVGQEGHRAVRALGDAGQRRARVFKGVGGGTVGAGDEVGDDRRVFVGAQVVGHNIGDRAHRDGDAVAGAQGAIAGDHRQGVGAVVVGRVAVGQSGQGGIDLRRAAREGDRAAAVAAQRRTGARRHVEAAVQDAHRRRQAGAVNVAHRHAADRQRRVFAGVLGARNGLGRRVIHRRDVHGQGVRARIKGAGTVLDLEANAGVGRAVGVGNRDELQVAGRDLAGVDGVVNIDRAAVEQQRAGGRQAGDLDRGQGLAGIGVGEAEVAGADDVGGAFGRRLRVVRTGRRCVGANVDGQGAGAARPARVGQRVGDGHRTSHIGRRGEVQRAVRVQADRAQARVGQHRVAHRQLGCRVVDVGVVGLDVNIGQRRVDRRAGNVRIGYRRVIHRRDVHGQGVRARIKGAGTVLDLEANAGVGRAVGVGNRDELQVAGRDLAGVDGVVNIDRAAVEQQRAGGRQAGDLDRGQGLAGIGVGEAEVAGADDVGGAFGRRLRVVRTGRRCVGANVDGQGAGAARPARVGQRVGDGHRTSHIGRRGEVQRAVRVQADRAQARVGQHRVAHRQLGCRVVDVGVVGLDVNIGQRRVDRRAGNVRIGYRRVIHRRDVERQGRRVVPPLPIADLIADNRHRPGIVGKRLEQVGTIGANTQSANASNGCGLTWRKGLGDTVSIGVDSKPGNDQRVMVLISVVEQHVSARHAVDRGTSRIIYGNRCNVLRSRQGFYRVDRMAASGSKLEGQRINRFNDPQKFDEGMPLIATLADKTGRGCFIFEQCIKIATGL